MKRLVALATLIGLAGSLGFILAGCGSKKAVSLGPPPRQTGSTGSTTATGTTPARSSFSFEVWFALGERLVPELRTHARTPRVATTALEALLAGPSRAERASGIATAIPAGTRLISVSIKRGVATADLTSEYQSGGGSLSMQMRLAQVVYTLTQFPTVKTVRFELDGAPVNVFSGEGIVLDHPVGRRDYKELSTFGAPVAGTWRRVPAAPISVDGELTSVWTGKQMLVFGNQLRDSKPVNVAASYDPATNAWHRLASPLRPKGAYLGNYSAVWTGKEMLLWGAFDYEAFNPATNRWRRLPNRPGIGHAGGIVVWTGREMIGWGGGCCGDAFTDGVAYSPATNRWRDVAPSPLAGSQHPIGAWTGRELIIFVGNRDPRTRSVWPARLARAAAYNPATDTWRRIPPLPEPRGGATAVWDGREVLVVGGAGEPRGGKPASLTTVGFAFNPATNRWRRLPPMESGRLDPATVWTGKRLLLWGGGTGRQDALVIPPHGLAYDPKTNRWSPLPQAPLQGRLGPTAVWTGRAMIVWGGGTSDSNKRFGDGAAFRPTP